MKLCLPLTQIAPRPPPLLLVETRARGHVKAASQGWPGSWSQASWCFSVASPSSSSPSFTCLAPAGVLIWGPGQDAGLWGTMHHARAGPPQSTSACQGFHKCILGNGALSLSWTALPTAGRRPQVLVFPVQLRRCEAQQPLPPGGLAGATQEIPPQALAAKEGATQERSRAGRPTWMAMGTILLARFLYSKQMGAARNCSVQGSVLLASMPSSSSKSTMKMFPCFRRQEEIHPNQFQAETDPRVSPRGREGGSGGPWQLSGVQNLQFSRPPAQRLMHTESFYRLWRFFGNTKGGSQVCICGT